MAGNIADEQAQYKEADRKKSHFVQFAKQSGNHFRILCLFIIDDKIKIFLSILRITQVF
jgi:hypothetical protein